MNELEAAIFIVPWLWIGGVTTVSALYRRRKGLPFLAKPPGDAFFVERRASGRLLESFRRFGGARNALLVAVSPTGLLIQPHFPFCLMFLPEIFGLEWRLSRRQIKRFEVVHGLLGARIRLAFSTAAGDDKVVELQLKDLTGFQVALGRRA